MFSLCVFSFVRKLMLQLPLANLISITQQTRQHCDHHVFELQNIRRSCVEKTPVAALTQCLHNVFQCRCWKSKDDSVSSSSQDDEAVGIAMRG